MSIKTTPELEREISNIIALKEIEKWKKVPERTRMLEAYERALRWANGETTMSPPSQAISFADKVVDYAKDLLDGKSDS